ncbi:MAG TPA: type III secretion HpaP family protein [Dokdonella sp.]|uniref:type III secretion HpaP family protein n=1 Tax=Dokdonella sp. TaxID=2291710 RepID=UPI0025C379F1|nr:type III secretion HpaP family protein [Dokdonella sp.]MBX3691615.1 hypothetical protein [Dokdonella sp.]MCW5567894.1 hypothetical protein [Dokdonella sp.]HNR90875.1 type III secretion HpaP family protein [Dokdonella sp.]
MRANANEARQEVRREHESALRRVREPASSEDIQQFRHLLEHPQGEVRQSGDDALTAQHPKAALDVRNDLVSAEMLALLHSHRLAFEPSPPVAPSLPPAAPGLTDLIERHVRRLLVSDSTAARGDARVMLRLSDSLLPGTDLTLTRSESGWVLRAEVNDAGSREALERCSDELVARFAKGGLGAIKLEMGGSG